jgi:hypothetical protein
MAVFNIGALFRLRVKAERNKRRIEAVTTKRLPNIMPRIIRET